MKILIGSDLHHEFGQLGRFPTLPDPSEYDVVVLAGDIDTGTKGLEWANKAFPKDKPVLYVAGNHEYYRHDYPTIRKQMQDLEMEWDNNIIVLDPGCVEIEGVTFIGGTMWSNLVYEGRKPDPVSKWQMDRSISDFRIISNGDRKFLVDDMIQVCNDEIAYFDQRLTEEAAINGKVVVVTHFLPSALCTAPQFAGSSLNSYFASDQDWLMEKHKIPVWIFGHTHTKMDFKHPSGTRLVCNPAGYPNENPQPFEWQIIEV